MSLVVAEQLCRTYTLGEVEVQALRGVDFTIEEGSLVSFVGPSGSGKTTLLNLIGCLDKPTGGRLWVDQTDVSRLSRNDGARFRGETIGFIFQDFNLIPVLTAYENIEFPLVMAQARPPAERHRAVGQLLEAVGMADHKDRRPDQLSGGQKQRVAVARALVTRPRLVLADEPTANLDSKTGRNIIELMKDLNENEKTTFVFSTHDPEILNYANEVIRIKDGIIAN
jgi:putative ABC transport system ATP-binding protein